MENKTDSIVERGEEVRSPSKKLNTKGCCFLCLQIVDFKAELGSDTIPSAKESISLKCVQRHLKVSAKQEGAEVDLCETCARIVEQFTKCFLSMEKFQMEVSYWTGLIQHQISEGSKSRELVQNYSKRMTSDSETLAQLLLVDKLRKDIGKTSSKEGPLTRPKVELQRSKNVEKYLMKSSPKGDLLDEDIDCHFEEDFSSNENYNSIAPSSCSPLANAEKGIKNKVLGAAIAEDTEVDDIVNAAASCHPPPSSAPCDSDDIPRISNVFSIKQAKMFNRNSTTGKFCCTLCFKELRSKAGARDHFKSIHIGIRYHCDICGINLRTNKSMKKHKEGCNGSSKQVKAKYGTKSTVNPQIRKYDCVKCKKEFTNSITCRRHYDSVHLQKRYECNLCKKSFSQAGGLANHRQICYKNSLPSRLAKQKAREADPNYRLPCKACGKKFPYKSDLLRHYNNVHLNERKHGCDLCEKTYKWQADLMEHKAVIHFGRRLYCKFCKKQCKYKRQLGVHEKICVTKPTGIETEAVKLDMN